MSYRHRMQVLHDRRAQRVQVDREEKLCYVEPHLRDYEAAYLEFYDHNIQAEYKDGWCVFKLGGRTQKYRLNALIAMTTVLHSRIHERAITNTEDAA